MMKRHTWADTVIILILALVALTSLAPLLHTLSLSVSDQSKANAGMITVYPQGFNLDSYKQIFKDHQFLQSFWVSVKRVFLTAVLSFLVTLLAAYPLSRTTRQFRLRNMFMWLFIVVLVFNGGLVPFYMVVKGIGLYNSMWALVLPMLLNVFNVILVINFFRGLPKELDESAALDGAGPWRILFTIYLPLSLPVMATITLFIIVNTWNDYMMGLLFARDQHLIPLQTYLQSLFIQIDPTRMSSDQMIELSKVSNQTLNASKIMVSLLPIVAIYPFLQRYFITGITLGSVKE
ncbi:carbohydrate ABC transporter permease [Paenibacillus albicereus]|uniref:Carbohydrate ABC transporter permease n=1 Tax=Paenibacillus albicereus TaxID=2726185 RepID=A0A6H2GWK5_9BACL|nr:carbohydrate ABC transporter permease [Paenibacillus albicereus]QJC51518.1 carbohydrate ABC transporter permease [Paenibacillus albicereus]